MDPLQPALVLERRIDVPFRTIETALDSGTVPSTTVRLEFSAGLLLDAPLRPRPDSRSDSSNRSWAATGTLITDRCRSVAWVEIEIGPWSDDTTRLELRPVARRIHRWGRRRLRRYFRLAHLAVEQTTRALTPTNLQPTTHADHELAAVG